MLRLQSFFDGNSFDAYTYFGAHLCAEGGAVFRVYAPRASAVSVWGDFNGWEPQPMTRAENGVFTRIEPKAKAGDYYKYRIEDEEGHVIHHADPFAFGGDLRPDWASRIVDLERVPAETLGWGPDTSDHYNRPINIYELHLGSWKQNKNDPNGWYDYDELAAPLIAYLKEHAYTHVEIMPLAEYPADESWGYQSSGFFAPTARYGSADQLKALVRALHEAGLGVILDFVPIHFVTNDYALRRFDGTALYEYPADATGYSEWGSHNFNFYRHEVRSFLKSAAAYWLREYHFDGLRMDAVRNAIYWQGDESRGVNEGAIRFLQELNQGLKEAFPHCLLIAEDSSQYNKITAPVQYGGLGFDYKWDMGWMNDTLEYLKTPAWERPRCYHKLTFSMHYFYQELYLLPLSHDEVVHGKKTILDKIAGSYDEKFPQGRTLYTYMMTHPGKKLNFMGNEFGQLREWDEKREQDWMLLSYPNHDSFLRYLTDLNRLYLAHPALFAGDYDARYFRWLQADAEADCVYAYQRTVEGDSLVVVLNFSDLAHPQYPIGIDGAKELVEVLSTDRDIYGGTTAHWTPRRIVPKKQTSGKWSQQFFVDLPPYSAAVFAVTPGGEPPRRPAVSSKR